MKRLLLSAGVAVALIACGGSSSNTNTNPNPPTVAPTGTSITISASGFNFQPAELTVDAGTTITVTNGDTSGNAHSVTSEAADGDFVKGSVAGVSFDTGPLSPASGTSNGPYGPVPGTGGQSATIQIPAGTPSGTVIPFFCTVHKGMMNPQNGHITVR